jgi:hypothetical protein
MRLRRGCGCPLLILMVLNIILVAGSVIGLIRGPTESVVQTTRWGSSFMLVLMLANSAICLIMGLASLRSQPIGSATTDGGAEGVDYDENTPPSDPDGD